MLLKSGTRADTVEALKLLKQARLDTPALRGIDDEIRRVEETLRQLPPAGKGKN